MKIQRLVFGFFLLLVVATIAGAQTTAKTNDSIAASDFFGSRIDGKYVNPYFGFKLAVPAGYTFIETEQAKLLNKAGADLLGAGNSQAAKKIDESIARTSNLFALTQLSVGMPDNAGLEAAVVKQQPSVTANMALAASVALYTKNPDFKVEKALGDVKFGGRAFAGSVVSGTLNGVPLKFELYAIMIRGYSILFAITYTTDEGHSNMLNVMKSIEFTK